MTDAITLPPDAVAIVDQRGCLTVAGRATFERAFRELTGQVVSLREILNLIVALDGSTADLLSAKADKSLIVLGSASIDSGTTTDLSENRIFQLVNDAETPGAHQVYGTNAAGTKGWQALYSGLSDYADDTAAAAGGVAIGSPYRTGSTLKVRIA